jgi:type II secretory pathway pseudopilin PulG
MPRFLKSRRNLVAFALIEVMAVSGIMSTMASQGSGGYRYAIDAARQTQGVNNLKQIYMMIQAECVGGGLPNAAFYPKGDPLKDPTSIAAILKGPREIWMSPFAPEAFKVKGLTYVWNDTVNGKDIGNVSKNTWLLIDMAAFITDPQMSKPPKYLILYADGRADAVAEVPADIKKVVQEAEAKNRSPVQGKTK